MKRKGVDYIYILSNGEKEQFKQELQEHFCDRFDKSEYGSWWYSAVDKDILITRFFQEEFLRYFFKAAYKRFYNYDNKDEIVFAYYVYLRDEFMPQILSKISNKE